MPNDVPRTASAPPRPRRVVVAGVASHGKGADGAEVEDLLVRRARTLRDEGVEVIWAGTGLEPEQVAAIGVSEDADAVEVAPAEATGDVTHALSRLEVDDVDVAAAAGEGDLTHG